MANLTVQPWTPNLIIPGVAKCGTTTIYDILVSHPEVTGGIEKEVRFLMDADENLATPMNVRDRGLAAWATQYPDSGKGDYRLWIDASPQYQYQQVALDTIAALDPQPRVLFIVRQPSRRLFSLYQYARYHQRAMPHVTSFARFIDEIRPPVTSRLRDQKMMVHAWEDSHYDRMLERWSAIVPAPRLYVMTVEELRDERVQTLTNLAHWLDIDPAGLLQAEVERSNPTVVTRSKWVKRLGARAAKILPENAVVRSIKTFIRELNSGEVDRNEMAENQALLDQLDAEFAPSMQRFETLRSDLRRKHSLGR